MSRRTCHAEVERLTDVSEPEIVVSLYVVGGKADFLAAIDIPAALLQTGIIGSIALVEVLAAGCAAVLAVAAARACRASVAAEKR
jgi:uncharacterized membrane protein YhfC